MKENKKAIVVGSGIAGIASALRLSAKGYEVTVCEANAYLGGKLTEIQLQDFIFDAGPSLFTLPYLVDDLFRLFGENPKDHFNYVKRNTLCHYFFNDGTFLPFYSDPDDLKKSIESNLHVDPKPVLNYLQKSKWLYDQTSYLFLENSLHRAKTYFDRRLFSSLFNLPKMGLTSTMHQANKKQLNHPKLVQIFDRFATYNGSNPYQAPAILNMIAHLESGIGSFFPEKGMHSITQSLVALGERNGVQFMTNCRVEEILVDRKRVLGVRTNQGIKEAEVVFCNSDIKPAYQFLLPKVKKPKRQLTQEPSSSALIFYWGMNRSFPNLDLHNLFFSDDYASEFRAIFQEGTVIDDPSVYVHVSSKVVSEHAPEGKENWFVMVNVPSNQNQDWTAIRERIRAHIIDKLSKILGVSIASCIAVEDYLDPIRIEQRTSSFKGALYGSSSNDRMAAFFRHANFSKVKGLYFVGGSVHPGGGIPLCLLSAKIAVEGMQGNLQPQNG